MCCALPLSAQWYRQPTPNDTLQSTRVLPNGKVLFQIYAPNAPLSAEQASILTVGPGHSWTTWRADLATLAPTLFR